MPRGDVARGTADAIPPVRDRPRHLVIKTGRGGRPLFYWQPSPSLRRLGFGPRRLSDDPAIARREAEELNAEADRYRDLLARGAFAGVKPGTVRWLIAQYRAHDDYLLLAEATRRSYLQCLDVIGRELGDARIESITPPVVQALKRSMAATPWQANAVLRVLRLLFSFGIREGYCRTNPARGFRQLPNPPRQVVWSHAQEARFLEACERLGRPSVALAVRLALWTAQRQGDILRLRWEDLEGELLRIRQAKTGRLVVVPVVGPLAEVLERAPRVAEVIVADERGRVWQADHFRHVFRKIARAAGVEGVRFSDLRRTAIVRLAEAGCTIAEISAISGHRIERCQRILETYLPRTAELAANAMAKRLRASTGGRGSVPPRVEV